VFDITKMVKIMAVKVYKIYDSRASETVLATYNNLVFAQSPSGKSVGTYEVPVAPEGVDKAVLFAQKKVIPKLDFGINQKDFDSELEKLCGENFSKSGSAVSVALSILNIRISAYNKKKSVYELYNKNPKKEDLPCLLSNTIGGGLHTQNKMPIQEILGTSKQNDFSKRVKDGIQFYKSVEKNLNDKKIFFGKNDEGAIAFNGDYKESLDIALKSRPNNFELGVDFASNSYYKNGKYFFGNKKMNERKYLKFIESVIEKYKLFFVEDPVTENSFEASAELVDKFGKEKIICGDDLFVTNVERLKEGIKNKSANGIIIKPNQIGCLSKTKEVVDLAKSKGITPVISHRSGETCDTTIAQLAVGWKIPYLKESLMNGERISKINELTMIYNDLSK